MSDEKQMIMVQHPRVSVSRKRTISPGNLNEDYKYETEEVFVTISVDVIEGDIPSLLNDVLLETEAKLAQEVAKIEKKYEKKTTSAAIPKTYKAKKSSKAAAKPQA